MVDMLLITDFFKTQIADKLIVFSNTVDEQTFFSTWAELYGRESEVIKPNQFYLITDWLPGYSNNSVQGENETDYQKLTVMVVRNCNNDNYPDFIAAQNEAKAIWFKQIYPRLRTKRNVDLANFNFEITSKPYEIEQGASENMYGISIDLLFKKTANYLVDIADEL